VYPFLTAPPFQPQGQLGRLPIVPQLTQLFSADGLTCSDTVRGSCVDLPSLHLVPRESLVIHAKIMVSNHAESVAQKGESLGEVIDCYTWVFHVHYVL
jgi:hypothetical protein